MFLRKIGLSLILTAICIPAYAQDWAEYVNQDERFGINFPGNPEIAA